MVTESKKPEFRVLFVCTGNTCRSPMAEGILKKLLRERLIDNIKVSSAGAQALDGYPAAIFALEATKLWDIDLSEHYSRKLTADMLRQADLILVMAPEHLQFIQRIDSGRLQKTFMLRAFPRKDKGDEFRVKDPIGGSLEEYNQCFLELDEEIRRILPEIVELSERKNEKKV